MTSTSFEPRDRQFPIIGCTLHGILPDDPKRQLPFNKGLLILLEVKTLYHRSYDGILLHCQSNSVAQEVLKESHDGICDAHQLGPKLMDRLCQLGYCCPAIIVDAVQYAKWCKACQIHANFIQQPQSYFIQQSHHSHLKHIELNL